MQGPEERVEEGEVQDFNTGSTNKHGLERTTQVLGRI